MDPTSRRFSWTSQDVRVYNASIGVGSIAAEGPYVEGGTPKRPTLAYPTLPLGLFYRAAPPILAPWRKGAVVEIQRFVSFQPQDLVHGEQSITWSQPGGMPVAATVRVDYAVTGIVQKKTGVVVEVTSSFFTLSTGEPPIVTPLCQSVGTMFLRRGVLTERGAVLASKLGEPRASPASLKWAPPSTDRVPPQRWPMIGERRYTTSPNQAVLYAINGDDNPLHVNYPIARAARFKQPILHGLCTFGFALRGVQAIVAEKAGGNNSIALQNVAATRCSARFARPVFPGATLVVRVHYLDTRETAVQPNEGQLCNAVFTVFVLGDDAALEAVCTHGTASFVLAPPFSLPRSKL